MDDLVLDIVAGDDIVELIDGIVGGLGAVPLPPDVPAHQIAPLAIALRNAQRDIEGGLTGRVIWGWLYVEYLWVTEARRGQGLGTRLMDAVESEARRRECQGLWVSTYSFQAPEFYERQGYQRFGEIDDFPKGHRRFFYKKHLTPTSPD